jgi:hypothetical protein
VASTAFSALHVAAGVRRGINVMQQVFSTKGTIDSEGRLQVDVALPVAGPSEVQLLVLLPEDAEISEHAWLRAAAANPAFDFLRDPAEDIYTLADGTPFMTRGKVVLVPFLG